jgi:hypothetical protein
MALASVTAAYTQFDANANWYASQTEAQLRLEAVEYLLAHRAEQTGDVGSSIKFESLQAMSVELRARVANRANGRSRLVRAAFCGSDGVQ